MKSFERYLFENIRNEILSWDAEIIKDIYAISLYIECFEDDPRKISAILGFNTNQHWREMIPQASDSMEAKWNYAFWLQNQELIIGDTDENGAVIHYLHEWISGLGLYYRDEDEEVDFDRTCKLGEKIIQEYVNLCIKVVRELHQTGIIRNKFKKDIPIIIHELEYYNEIAAQNKQANPPNVVDEFVKWIESME